MVFDLPICLLYFMADILLNVPVSIWKLAYYRPRWTLGRMLSKKPVVAYRAALYSFRTELLTHSTQGRNFRSLEPAMDKKWICGCRSR